MAVLAQNAKVCVFHKGEASDGKHTLLCSFFDDRELWWKEMEIPNGGVTAGLSALYNQSNKETYIFYQGPNHHGSLLYNVFNSDTSAWEGEKSVPDTGMSGVPASVLFHGRIFCFHQGLGEDNSLWYNVMDPETGEWAGEKQLLPSNIKLGPSAVVFENKLYCFHRAAYKDELIYNVYDGEDWTGQKAVPLTCTSPEPSAIVYHNKLFCFHEGGNNDGTLWYNVFDGTSWLGDQKVPVSLGAVKGHCAVVAGTFLYCFYRKGNDSDRVWFIVFDASDGSWSTEHRMCASSGGVKSSKLAACSLLQSSVTTDL